MNKIVYLTMSATIAIGTYGTSFGANNDQILRSQPPINIEQLNNAAENAVKNCDYFKASILYDLLLAKLDAFGQNLVIHRIAGKQLEDTSYNTAVAYNNLGIVLIKQHKFNNAKQMLLNAMKCDTNNALPQIKYNLGIVHQQLNETDLAIKCYK